MSAIRDMQTIFYVDGGVGLYRNVGQAVIGWMFVLDRPTYAQIHIKMSF